jgi:phosphate transport system substrate-binding protein
MGGSYNIGGWGLAIDILVNKDNPIKRLTIQQLDGIFGSQRSGGYQGTTWNPEVARGPESNIRTWGQLGLTGEWADKPIRVHAGNNYYDTHWDIQRQVFGGGDKWNENMVEYTNYANPDGSFHIGWYDLANAVANDKYAIGYDFPYAVNPGVKAVAIARDRSSPAFEPSEKTYQDMSYPLRSDNYWYFNRKPGTLVAPMIREYLRYVLSRDGQQDMLDNGRMLPIPAAVVAEQLAKLQ